MEGLKVANEIEKELEKFAHCDLWTSIFGLNDSNYDNLSSQVAFYDYAVLIATGDDVLQSRGKTYSSMRDNVLVEFGLFSGGLGKARVILVVEDGVKIPSDLNGISVVYLPSPRKKAFGEKVKEGVALIKDHIVNKENTFDLSFLPSTTLAYGYFCNFVEKTVERLLEDKAAKKEFKLASREKFIIDDLKFTILIPNDLSDDMFKKVAAKRLRDGWQKMKVEPKYVRDYDFSIDVSKAGDGCMHLVDIPLTLNALNQAIELYSKKSHIGKTQKEQLLEQREIRNFKHTLEYLIKRSPFAKDIVNVEVVEI